MSSAEEKSQGPVIRDRRRIDPDTGQGRDPEQTGAGQAGAAASGRAPAGRHAATSGRQADTPAPAAPTEPSATAARDDSSSAAETQRIAQQLAERTADLQRLQAEYANYRKRVERDRIAVREQALANVLAELLPILDDIGRAREHGELSGGFKSVAESVESAVTKLGLVRYGEKGEPFDPMVHEALTHSYSDEVTEPTCVQVLLPGYKVGDRILRPARVAVAEPGGEEPTAGDKPGAGADGSAARGKSKPEDAPGDGD
ncbi:MAG TPA: nucleotide exchange factor GrpE [Streptosporangiaceae bacterium]|nr:nucleotide exchange factor GrpE [Streptosporangiaceae bacterium]